MFSNVDLYVCYFAICDIGMKVEEMKIEKMSVIVCFCFFNHVYAELLVTIIDLHSIYPMN